MQKLKIKRPTIELMEEYKGTQIKMLYKCKLCKETFMSLPSNIHKGIHICEDLEKNIAIAELKHEEYLAKLKNKNMNHIIPLEKYINNKTRIKHKCNLCEYMFISSPDRILSKGHKCDISRRRTITSENFEKYICDIYGNDIKILSKFISMYEQIEYVCNICGYKGKIAPSTLLHGKNNYGCSKCKLKNSTKKLYYTNPNLAKLLVNIEDAYKYARTSKVKVDWKCDKCGTISNKGINTVTLNGLSCSGCSDGISIQNKFMFNILKQSSIMFDNEISFDWARFEFKDYIYNPKYDFYIEFNNRKIIIELDGVFHYKQYPNSKLTIDDIRFIDNRKNELAIKNGYEIYRVEMFQNTFIFLSRMIGFILDCIGIYHKNINFEDAYYKATSTSKVIEVCELWNNGVKKLTEISKITGVSTNTISKYLYRMTKLGRCNYIPHEHKRKRYKQ